LVRAGQWNAPDNYASPLDPPVIWQKYKRGLTLKHFQDNYGNRPPSQFWISDKDAQDEVELENVCWADFDHRGRLILAQEGKLFTAAISGEGELTLTELADFNANKPESIEAPGWARQW
jgi:hypothetical protein